MVLLGASTAATWLVEGFVLGIVAHLHALLVAVLAIVVALVIAAYLKRAPRTAHPRIALEPIRKPPLRGT